MLKQIPTKLTYAQEKIIKLIQERKLRQWCIENGLPHSAIYRIGLGEQPPSYKMVSSMVHLIAPVEWLFYTDETLPYESKVVPQWNPAKQCKFIKENKSNHKEIAKKYGISEISAYNICMSRAIPGLAFIRECCKDTNPIDFFIDGEEPETPKKFTPDRGDIVNILGNIFLVLSKKEKSEIDGYLVCCPILKVYEENSIELTDTRTKGFIKPNNIQTNILTSRSQANFIETVSEEITHNILGQVKHIFD